MPYHTDVRTHSKAFVKPVNNTEGEVDNMLVNSTFLKQTDQAGLELGWPP